MNWTLKASAVARARIRQLEKKHGLFDAALFNNVMPATFLGEFGRRVPFGISMDCTPHLIRSEPYRKWFLGGPERKAGIRAKLTHAITRQLYANSAFLLPYSSVACTSLIHDYGVDAKKIAIEPVGVDVDQWKPNSIDRTAESKSSGLSVFFVGGDFERKGGDIVMQAAQLPEFQDCTFHFLTRKTLASVPQNVRVHTGIPPNSRELMQLYADADVFVMPTRAEFPQTNALLEAMAMELPVITTNLAGLDEVVIDGETGFIIPPDNLKDFSQRLMRLKTDSELRMRMGKKGRKKVEREFNLATISENILTHLERATTFR